VRTRANDPGEVKDHEDDDDGRDEDGNHEIAMTASGCGSLSCSERLGIAVAPWFR
jgi:hypothetical protein